MPNSNRHCCNVQVELIAEVEITLAFAGMLATTVCGMLNTRGGTIYLGTGTEPIVPISYGSVGTGTNSFTYVPYSLPQCCGAQIIYFQLHFFPLFWLRLQLQPYIATYKCTITVVPCDNMSQWRLKLVFLHPSILHFDGSK